MEWLWNGYYEISCISPNQLSFELMVGNEIVFLYYIFTHILHRFQPNKHKITVYVNFN